MPRAWLNPSISDELSRSATFRKGQPKIEIGAIPSDPGRGEACLAPGLARRDAMI